MSDCASDPRLLRGASGPGRAGGDWDFHGGRRRVFPLRTIQQPMWSLRRTQVPATQVDSRSCCLLPLAAATLVTARNPAGTGLAS